MSRVSKWSSSFGGLKIIGQAGELVRNTRLSSKARVAKNTDESIGTIRLESRVTRAKQACPARFRFATFNICHG
jgi:hypothetical protein